MRRELKGRGSGGRNKKGRNKEKGSEFSINRRGKKSLK